MKILLVHEHYREPGGEDAVFAAERDLLSRAGHEILTFEEHNQRIDSMGRIRLAATTVWSRRSASKLRQLVRKERPQIAHFHNTFPLLSPSVYHAVRGEGAAVVQSLHNFRLLCLNSLFLRQERVCQDCFGHLPWRGIVHRCYRSNLGASAVLATMIGAHRALGTWSREVDAYVVLTDFSRRIFEDGGLPHERLHVKPNFLLDDPEPGSGDGDFLLFAGRLAPEKGVELLLDCWHSMGASAPRLRIAGQGPLAQRVQDSAEVHDRIEYLGPCSTSHVRALMRQATALFLPSLWFEGLPMVVVEAFGSGLPVIASRIGGLPELIEDGRSGWLVPPGNKAAWCRAAQAASHSKGQIQRFRAAARSEYERRFTASSNLRRLLEIYARARSGRSNMNRQSPAQTA